MTAVKTAKEKGALIFLDANFALPLWQNPAETDALLEPLWAQADVVELSLAEVEFLLGETYFALRRRGRSQYISPTENRPEVVREEYHYTREELQQVNPTEQGRT